MSDSADLGFPLGALVASFGLTLLVMVPVGTGMLAITEAAREDARFAAAIERAWGSLAVAEVEQLRAADMSVLTEQLAWRERHEVAGRAVDDAIVDLQALGGSRELSRLQVEQRALWEAQRRAMFSLEGSLNRTYSDVTDAQVVVDAASVDLRTSIDGQLRSRRETASWSAMLLALAGLGSAALLMVSWMWSLARVRRWLSDSASSPRALPDTHGAHRLAVDALGIGTWEVDLIDDPVVRWSEYTAQLIGMPAGTQPATAELLRRVVNEDREAVIRAMLEAMQPGGDRRVSERFRVQEDDVTVRWVEVKAQVEFTECEPSRAVRIVGVLRDVSELVTLEQARQRWMSTMEATIVARTDEAVQRAADAKALAVELSQAERSERQRLARVLHDGLQQLLVAARLRVAVLSGTPELQSVRVELDSLLAESIQASRSLAVELDPPVSFEDGLGPPLVWLAGWMRRRHKLDVAIDVVGIEAEVEPERGLLVVDIVRELLFNVVKHSGVMCAKLDIEQRPGRAMIRVSDEGRGFDPARSDDSFGLSSLERRVGALGGSLRIDAGVGRGCRTTIRLGLPTPTRVEVVPSLELGDQLRVLVVDDHDLVRRGVVALLSAQHDLDVVGQVGSGEEALSAVDVVRPDVVVMDVSLPGMDGVEATRRLVDRHPQIRVVGLSAEASPQLSARLLAAGAVTLVPKGDAPDLLVDAVRGLLPDP